MISPFKVVTNPVFVISFAVSVVSSFTCCGRCPFIWWHLQLCIYSLTNTYTHILTHTYIYTHAQTHICAHICTHTLMRTHTSTCIHAHAHTDTLYMYHYKANNVMVYIDYIFHYKKQTAMNNM